MTEENTEAKKITKTELLDSIKGLVAAQLKDLNIEDLVNKAVEPLKVQVTENMAKIATTSNQKSVMEKGTDGIGAARFVRAMAAAKGNADRAAAFAKKAWNDDLGDVIQKALGAGDFTAGGALIPPALAAEVIEFLRAKTIVRAAGARVVPMPRGTISFRAQTGTINASYVGESADIGKTQPTVGQVTLTAKKLAALVPISNDLLLYDADVTADAFVRDDLVRAISVREDLAFIRGDGLSDTPKGIRYWAPTSNINAWTSSWAATTNVEADLMGQITLLESANVDMTQVVWFMNPRTKNYLRTLRNANGFLVFPTINDVNPTIYGKPVFVSTNIPKNLGTGGNETEIYLVGMQDILIGEAGAAGAGGGLAIDVSPDASYIDGSLVSSFSRDETVIRAILRHDLGCRHRESISILTGVTK
jgi:HK97 family phage major capsid protein